MASQNRDRRVLAAGSWVGFTYDTARERYDGFLQRARPAFKMLIESIIIHRHISVPTEDFLSLTALVGVLGESAVTELLERDVLDFVRVTGALACVGDGGGIVHINFPYSGNEPSAIGADLPDAIKWALSPFQTDPHLAKLAAAHSKEVDLFSLSETIAERTYADFIRLPYAKGLDPKRLPGISGRQVQILGGQAFQRVADPITALLSIASANLELELMAQTGSADANTSTPIGHTLKAREEEVGLHGEKFSTLREIAEVPDVAEAVLEKRINISELLALHGSDAGADFREWFHENCSADPIATARAYVDLLKTIPIVQSLPAKIFRFIVTNALGFVPVIGPILGVVAGGIDTFAVEKIADLRGPKFFIEKLQQIETTVPPNSR